MLPVRPDSDLSDGATQHDGEPPVELGACVLREVVPLTYPGERVGEGADTNREIEGAGQTLPPGLQIRVPQSHEPRIARRQLGELLEEPDRHDQRSERMRDRRVSPVEETEPVAIHIEVGHVEVVVLNRLRYVVRGELAATTPRTVGQTCAAERSRRAR